jgi:hypothetical protein
MEELLKAKCCVCEKPMKSSRSMNVVILEKKPTWDYPIVGNVLYDVPDKATATVCDSCIDRFNDPKDVKYIKWAVELRKGEVIYHAVETLEAILSKADTADFEPDAHNCSGRTYPDDDGNLRCDQCDRIVKTSCARYE